MMEENKFGTLLSNDAKIFRQYFEELVSLIGIQVFYRAPMPGKTYTSYTEIESNYYDPIQVGCIFTDHPDQQTLKKMGWVSELQENSSIIHVPYDLPELQQGALFFLPSGLDNSPSRLFRVVKMQNIMMYPSSIACEIVPEFESTFKPEQYNYDHSSFNVLMEQDEDMPKPLSIKILKEEN